MFIDPIYIVLGTILAMIGAMAFLLKVMLDIQQTLKEILGENKRIGTGPLASQPVVAIHTASVGLAASQQNTSRYADVPTDKQRSVGNEQLPTTDPRHPVGPNIHMEATTPMSRVKR